MWTGKFKFKTRKCLQCDKEFTCPLFRDSKYCSRSCCIASPIWKSKVGAKKGVVFSKERNAKISRALTGKIRTKEHSKNISLAKKGQKHTPELRKKRSALYKKLYAGGIVKVPIMRGRKNPNWKGGISELAHVIRTSARFIKWRGKVYKRDHYTCRGCGDSKGGNLHPHHIRLFSEFPALRFRVSNGLTLCKKCHHKIHLGKRNSVNPLSKLLQI